MQTDAGIMARGASSSSGIHARRVVIAIAGGAEIALTAVHVGLSRLPLQEATPLAPLDSVFAVTLVLGLIALAGAVGSRLLQWAAIAWHNTAERAVFSTTIGLVVFAYVVMAFAFCHLLYAPLLLTVAVLAAIIVHSELRRIGVCVCRIPMQVRHATVWRVNPVPWIAGSGALVLLLLLPVALLPPFGYDALWYHLAAPRIFLEQHSYVLLPSIQQAAFPFTVEMLYTICLAFASDVSPALLHLSFAVLTAVGAWSLGARYFDRRTGWLAVAGLLTASDLNKLAVIPDIDLALMLFEFLAVYALLVWLEERRPGWLYVAAVMAGLAMGSKYTALALLAPLCPLLLFGGGYGLRRLRAGIRPLAVFTVCALLVASPWYLKNLIVFHDPLYPLLSLPYVDPRLDLPPVATSTAPHSAFNPVTVALLPLRVLQSGSDLSLTGRSFSDYLQLPLQVYLRGDLEMYGHPSLLFVLAPLALLFNRRPVVLRLAIVALVMAIIWALGPQELRYLVPVCPLLALLSAIALLGLAARFRSRRAVRLVVLLPVLFSLALTVAEDVYLFGAMQPLPVLAGLQSKDAFLRRVVTSYGAMAYLAGVIQPGQRVLALGESRSYYDTIPLIIDGSRNLGTRVFVDAGTPQKAASVLARAGVAYVMINNQDMSFQATIAPGQVQQETVAFRKFRQRYLTLVYQGDALQVYRVTEVRSAG